jgi:hypothetical protein
MQLDLQLYILCSNSQSSKREMGLFSRLIYSRGEKYGEVVFEQYATG